MLWVLCVEIVILVVILIIGETIKQMLSDVNGIVLIGMVDFDKLNEKINYVTLLRSAVMYFKPVDIFTRTVSHFATFIKTDNNSYIISPDRETLWVYKLNSKHDDISKKCLKVMNTRYMSSDKILLRDQCTVLEYVNYAKQVLTAQKYNVKTYNCQGQTVAAINHFNPNINLTSELIDGNKLYRRCVKELFSLNLC